MGNKDNHLKVRMDLMKWFPRIAIKSNTNDGVIFIHAQYYTNAPNVYIPFHQLGIEIKLVENFDGL